MDAFKTWLVEVGIKKLAPTAIIGAISAIVSITAAHSGVLEKFGISSNIDTGDIIIHSKMLKAWIDSAAGIAAISSLSSLFQHHVTAAVTGAPQSGDLRKEPVAPVEGGDRKSDPPAA